MAWINTYLNEGNLQNELGILLEQYGWEKKTNFFKVAFPQSWVRPLAQGAQPVLFLTGKVYVSEHFIFKSPGNMLYGLSRVAELDFKSGDLPAADGPPRGADNDNFDAFGEWAKTRISANKALGTWYMYMAEQVPTIAPNKVFCIPWEDGETLRAAVDIEVHKAEVITIPPATPGAQPSYRLKVSLAYPVIMQSPFTVVHTRVPSEEKTDMKYWNPNDVTGQGVTIDHNWWDDSHVNIYGRIEDDVNSPYYGTFFFICQADRANAFEDNRVPNFPWLWGRLVPVERDFEVYADGTSTTYTIPRVTAADPVLSGTWKVYVQGVEDGDATINENTGAVTFNATPAEGHKILIRYRQDNRLHALIAGTATDTVQPTYDYDRTQRHTPFTETKIMPILKKYQYYPGNGIDTIMVHRTMQGSRYQAHYLDWDTVANDVPPTRNNAGRKYPQAYKGPGSPVYNYQVNPSRYTDMVDSSRAYVVHPDEGFRAELPFTILMNPISLQDMNKLKVRTEYCDGNNKRYEYDIYRYFLVESISPFTKRPATVYRPAGIGIFEGKEVRA